MPPMLGASSANTEAPVYPALRRLYAPCFTVLGALFHLDQADRGAVPSTTAVPHVVTWVVDAPPVPQLTAAAATAPATVAVDGAAAAAPPAAAAATPVPTSLTPGAFLNKLAEHPVTIALRAPVGAGKTSLLAQLVRRQHTTALVLYVHAVVIADTIGNRADTTLSPQELVDCACESAGCGWRDDAPSARQLVIEALTGPIVWLVDACERRATHKGLAAFLDFLQRRDFGPEHAEYRRHSFVLAERTPGTVLPATSVATLQVWSEEDVATYCSSACGRDAPHAAAWATALCTNTLFPTPSGAAASAAAAAVAPLAIEAVCYGARFAPQLSQGAVAPADSEWLLLVSQLNTVKATDRRTDSVMGLQAAVEDRVNILDRHLARAAAAEYTSHPAGPDPAAASAPPNAPPTVEQLRSALLRFYDCDPRCHDIPDACRNPVPFDDMYQPLLVVASETEEGRRNGDDDPERDQTFTGDTLFGATQLAAAGNARTGPPVVLIEGPGGMGKSTLLRYAARRQSGTDGGDHVVVLVDLVELLDRLGDRTASSVEDVLDLAIPRSAWDHSQRDATDTARMHYDDAHQQLRHTPVLLLLDGLDEVASVSHPALAYLLQSVLRQPTARNPRDAVVVTSRAERASTLFRGVNVVSGALKLNIRPWTEGDVRRYAMRCFARVEAFASDAARREAADAVAKAPSRPGLAGITGVPFMYGLLCAYCVIHTEAKAFDAAAFAVMRPHDVLDFAVRQLLHREPEVKAGVDEATRSALAVLRTEPDRVLRWLGREALTMAREERRTLLTGGSVEPLNAALPRCGLLECIRPAFGSNPATYRFVHTVFFDYFTALGAAMSCDGPKQARAHVKFLLAKEQHVALVLLAALTTTRERGQVMSRADCVEALRTEASREHQAAVLVACALVANATEELLAPWAARGDGGMLRALLEAAASHRSPAAAEALTHHQPALARCSAKDILTVAATSGSAATFAAVARGFGWQRDNPASLDHKQDLLCVAAANDNTDVVRFLLRECGANVDEDGCAERNFGRMAPLRWAAARGNGEALRCLVAECGADAHARWVDGSTPLHWAARWGNAETVRCLVTECGADPNARSKDGSTPLHWAARWGNAETVRCLVTECGADPNARSEGDTTPLHWAAHGGSAETVRWLVTECSADANARSEDDTTPLHVAAANGSAETVRWLVTECGADANARSKDGRTPLYWAAEGGRAETVRWLVTECGADANARSEDDSTPLHRAAFWGNAKTVRCLVTECGADAHARWVDGRTPLHWAARWGSAETVRCLVTECGADINARSEDGRTPLHRAAARARAETVRCLVTEFGVDVNARSEDGRTPLHVAAESGRAETVRCLVTEFGVDVNARSKDGRTPLHVVAESGSAETVRWLLTECCAGSGADAGGQSGPVLDSRQANETFTCVVM